MLRDTPLLVTVIELSILRENCGVREKERKKQDEEKQFTREVIVDEGGGRGRETGVSDAIPSRRRIICTLLFSITIFHLAMSPLPHVHSDGLPVPQCQELVSFNVIDVSRRIPWHLAALTRGVQWPRDQHESILALEERIEKGDGDIIRLKRARNSLLNISARAPPEILGKIFVWCLVEGYPFYFR